MRICRLRALLVNLVDQQTQVFPGSFRPLVDDQPLFIDWSLVNNCPLVNDWPLLKIDIWLISPCGHLASALYVPKEGIVRLKANQLVRNTRYKSYHRPQYCVLWCPYDPNKHSTQDQRKNKVTKAQRNFVMLSLSPLLCWRLSQCDYNVVIFCSDKLSKCHFRR